MTEWSGVFPAVTTKFDATGRVDPEAIQASIERLIAGGVSGIIVLPMLGENASLGDGERETVVRAAAEAVAGRVPLLSGLAETSAEKAAFSAQAYQRYGAEGLMAFPNIGYKTDPRETAWWYRHIATSSDLPVMVYNNPIAYGVDVTPAILADLAETPGIRCIKEETGDPRRVTDLYAALGDRFAIFCGIDDLLLESLALGVTGWVSGMTNAWPAECVTLFNLASASHFKEALELYRILTPAFHLDTHVKLVQYIKLAEHLVYGASETVRAPRLPLQGSEREMVITVVQKTIANLDRYATR